MTRRRFRDCGADGRLIRDIGHGREVRGTGGNCVIQRCAMAAEHCNRRSGARKRGRDLAADAPPAACDERVGGTRQSGHAQPP